ncbi:MAG: cyclic nucleotide-binding domain-containing protein [Acidimicrobiales bacterium]
MSEDVKERRLAGLRLFRGADAKAIRHLASAADEVSVGAGHVLIRQGHNHQELYIIESGGAVVEVDDEQVAEIPAGELIGELGYFVRTTASATVTTSADSTVMVIPYNRFAQILGENPGLVLTIATELAERLHAMDVRLQHDHMQ